MRIMKSNQYGTELKVTQFLMTTNMWEYYVLKAPENTDDIKQCLVLGYAEEIGDVSMSEIKLYLIVNTKKLDEVAPAPGYAWVIS